MKDWYIVSKACRGIFTESLFVRPINLIHFLIFWSIWVLKLRFESRMIPKCWRWWCPGMRTKIWLNCLKTNPVCGGIPEKLGSGRMVWTLRLWISGRLDSGHSDSGRLDTWTLDDWTLGLWTAGRLDCGPLGYGQLDASLGLCTLGLWTTGCMDSGGSVSGRLDSGPLDPENSIHF